MTHLQLLKFLNDNSLLEDCAMLYDKMYHKSHAKSGKIIDVERFMYAIADCMFEKNAAQVVDADLRNEKHVMALNIIAYQCAMRMLNERAEEMIAKLKRACGQL